MSEHTDNERALDQRLAHHADVLMGTEHKPLTEDSDVEIRDLAKTMLVFKRQAHAIHSKQSVKTRIFKSMKSAWKANLTENSRFGAPTRSVTRFSPVLRGFAFGLTGLMVVIIALIGYAQMTGATTSGLMGTAAGNTTLLSIGVLILGGLVIFLLISKDKK